MFDYFSQYKHTIKHILLKFTNDQVFPKMAHGSEQIDAIRCTQVILQWRLSYLQEEKNISATEKRVLLRYEWGHFFSLSLLLLKLSLGLGLTFLVTGCPKTFLLRLQWIKPLAAVQFHQNPRWSRNIPRWLHGMALVTLNHVVHANTNHTCCEKGKT